MSEPQPYNRSVKIVVIGDGTVGKTCLCYFFTTNEFLDHYVPVIHDNYAKRVSVDGIEYSVTVWDTAGQEDYDRLRPLAYPQTDCFIVCFAMNNRASFVNIEKKWIPELKSKGPKAAAVILLGTKSDLEGEDEFISEKEGEELKSKIKANHFLTCSAKTRKGVDEAFVEAIRAIVRKEKAKKICSQV